MTQDNLHKTKVRFITGASKGFGLALVKHVLANGDKVAATSRHSTDIENKIDSNKENLLALTVDITQEESVTKAVRQANEHFGHLDVIVNNAGYSIYGSVEALTDKEFRQTIDVNLFGTVNVIRAAMPYLRKQGSGHVINIASVAGYKGYGNSPSYAAGKFAVVGMSEALAEEVKPFGVKVTVVAPGFFRTSFLDKGENLVSKNRIPEYNVEALESYLKNMNGRQPGDPDKLVDALIKITDEPNPPVHLLMGPDAYKIVTEKRKAENDEFEAWKHITLSTDF
jgi:NAD(P)-dependent dehydrogenase (short-subunit alcohol dehydrogenase family)